eukprot:gene5763-4128_t
MSGRAKSKAEIMYRPQNKFNLYDSMRSVSSHSTLLYGTSNLGQSQQLVGAGSQTSSMPMLNTSQDTLPMEFATPAESLSLSLVRPSSIYEEKSAASRLPFYRPMSPIQQGADTDSHTHITLDDSILTDASRDHSSRRVAQQPIIGSEMDRLPSARSVDSNITDRNSLFQRSDMRSVESYMSQILPEPLAHPAGHADLPPLDVESSTSEHDIHNGSVCSDGADTASTAASSAPASRQRPAIGLDTFATATSTSAGANATHPVYEVRLLNVSAWTLESSSVQLRALNFKIGEFIAYRESLLKQFEALLQSLDRAYWQYAVQRIETIAKNVPQALLYEPVVLSRNRLFVLQQQAAVCLAHLRAIAISICEGIVRLRALCRREIQTTAPVSVFYRGENYLLKMWADLRALCAAAPSPLLYWTGFVPDPLVIPPEEHEHQPQRVWQALARPVLAAIKRDLVVKRERERRAVQQHLHRIRLQSVSLQHSASARIGSPAQTPPTSAPAAAAAADGLGATSGTASGANTARRRAPSDDAARRHRRGAAAAGVEPSIPEAAGSPSTPTARRAGLLVSRALEKQLLADNLQPARPASTPSARRAPLEDWEQLREYCRYTWTRVDVRIDVPRPAAPPPQPPPSTGRRSAPPRCSGSGRRTAPRCPPRRRFGRCCTRRRRRRRRPPASDADDASAASTATPATAAEAAAAAASFVLPVWTQQLHAAVDAAGAGVGFFSAHMHASPFAMEAALGFGEAWPPIFVVPPLPRALRQRCVRLYEDVVVAEVQRALLVDELRAQLAAQLDAHRRARSRRRSRRWRRCRWRRRPATSSRPRRATSPPPTSARRSARRWALRWRCATRSSGAVAAVARRADGAARRAAANACDVNPAVPAAAAPRHDALHNGEHAQQRRNGLAPPVLAPHARRSILVDAAPSPAATQPPAADATPTTTLAATRPPLRLTATLRSRVVDLAAPATQKQPQLCRDADALDDADGDGDGDAASSVFLTDAAPATRRPTLSAAAVDALAAAIVAQAPTTPPPPSKAPLALQRSIGASLRQRVDDERRVVAPNAAFVDAAAGGGEAPADARALLVLRPDRKRHRQRELDRLDARFRDLHATNIQRIVRALLAKRRVKKLRNQRAWRRVLVKLQTLVRGFVVKLRKQREAHEAKVAIFIVRKQALLRFRAAVTITRAFRQMANLRRLLRREPLLPDRLDKYGKPMSTHEQRRVLVRLLQKKPSFLVAATDALGDPGHHGDHGHRHHAHGGHHSGGGGGHARHRRPHGHRHHAGHRSAHQRAQERDAFDPAMVAAPHLHPQLQLLMSQAAGGAPRLLAPGADDGDSVGSSGGGSWDSASQRSLDTALSSTNSVAIMQRVQSQRRAAPFLPAFPSRGPRRRARLAARRPLARADRDASTLTATEWAEAQLRLQRDAAAFVRRLHVQQLKPPPDRLRHSRLLPTLAQGLLDASSKKGDGLRRLRRVQRLGQPNSRLRPLCRRDALRHRRDARRDAAAVDAADADGGARLAARVDRRDAARRAAWRVATRRVAHGRRRTVARGAALAATQPQPAPPQSLSLSLSATAPLVSHDAVGQPRVTAQALAELAALKEAKRLREEAAARAAAEAAAEAAEPLALTIDTTPPPEPQDAADADSVVSEAKSSVSGDGSSVGGLRAAVARPHDVYQVPIGISAARRKPLAHSFSGGSLSSSLSGSTGVARGLNSVRQARLEAKRRRDEAETARLREALVRLIL